MTLEREATFSSFFHEHEPAVRRTARGLVTQSEVDHVVAATFTTAWRRFAEIPDGAPRAWLVGVTRNHSRNLTRSRRRRTMLVDTLTALRPMDAADLFADRVDPLELARLHAAVARLSEQDRELIRLAVWQELQPAEIAAAMGTDASAVRVRLHRARRRLILLMNETSADQD
ncbi:MAG: sigma-70 family RNA polymerase sigma factor [Actinomycetota bacterium]|nr:sigma-70 family RNA polymerase sigma factor [Actinomycetota bacterium]